MNTNICIFLEERIKNTIFNKGYKTSDNLNDVLFKVFVNGLKNEGDYIFKGHFKLSKLLTKESSMLNPKEILELIISSIDLRDNFTCKISNNFLIINLTEVGIKKYFINVFNYESIIKKDNYKENILVDFSSPNIAKDMHVGHLRSTIIGDTICRLYEKKGHNVYRINHIGDFGLQFGMIIQYLFEEYDDLLNCQLTNKDLQMFYSKSKERFTNDNKFKNEAYKRVVELQGNCKKTVDAWNFIKNISKKSYDEIYNKLNVEITEVGESFYQNLIPIMIKELKKKNLITIEDGRMLIYVEGCKIPATVVKSNGGYTYDTTDLAALRYRLLDLGMDSIYYVVDVGQSQHFELIFKIAEKAGWLTNQKVKHISFGLVLGDNGKRFRSRNGDTVKLNDLLNGAISKASEVLKQRKTELNDYESKIAIENIAYGAIKYADLSTCRTTSYKFSYDKMLSLDGNTAVYLLYAYVRVCAIVRNSGIEPETISSKINQFEVNHEQEKELCKFILNFQEIIKRVSSDFNFNILCDYLYNLSKKVHSFFKNCRCLNYNSNKEIINVNFNRLLICIMVKRVMLEGFYILNIKPLERM